MELAQLPWFWIWLVLAAALFIGEMLTLSLFLLPFAVGALIAALANGLGLDLVWQFALFIVVSIISLVALRPVAKRLTRKGDAAKVGAERLVGMHGRVVEGRSSAGEFRVNVDRELWNASAEDGTLPPVGVEVLVLAINSNSLYVRTVG